jgi:hypothetical protein
MKWNAHDKSRAVKATSKNRITQSQVTVSGIETKGVEQFIHTGNWYVAFRDLNNIQLE